MFSRIRKRFTFANVVMVFALVFAMTGGAYAASKYVITSTKQISPKVLKQLQGKGGPKGQAGASGEAGSIGSQGPGGPAGPNGKNGENGAPGSAGLSGKSVVGRPFSGSEEPPAEPCKGLGGSEFEVNASQSYACNGKIGADGKTVLSGSGAPASATGVEGYFYIDTTAEEIYGPKTASAWGTGTKLQGEKGEPWTPNNVLPSKATETGGWAFGDGNASTEGYAGYPNKNIRTAISFPIPLSAALEESNVKGLKVGEGETTECPGTVTKPEAEPGYLCVYSGELTGLSTEFGGALQRPFVRKLSSGASPEPGANTSGAMLFFYQEEATTHGNGTWAVTAP